MGVLHFLAGIVLQGRAQGAGFHAVEDVLGIDEAALRGVEVKTGPVKFFLQQGNVVAVGVVARQVGLPDEVVELLGDLLEGRFPRQVLVGKSVDGRGLGGDGDGGVDLHLQFPGGATAGGQLYQGDLDDTVLNDVEPRGL